MRVKTHKMKTQPKTLQRHTGEAGSSPNGSEFVKKQGLHISRRFTQPEIHPFDELEWTRRTSVIANPDGSVVFKMEDTEIPSSWSQLATDIVVSKYFRKAGV